MQKRFWAAAALTAGCGTLAFFFGTGQAWTRPFGAVLADQPLVAVQSGEGATVLLNVPGPRERMALGQLSQAKIAPVQQGVLENEIRAARPLLVEAAGEVSRVEPGLRTLRFEDPATGEPFSQQVLSAEGPAGVAYFSRPDDRPMLRNPRNPELFLLERNSALFLLDARQGTVQPVGAAAERKALAETAEAESRRTGGEAHAVWAVDALWSADGRKIAFRTNRDTLSETALTVWVHDLATGREVPVLTGQAAANTIPWGWTPQGEILLVRYHNKDARAPRTSIVAVSLDSRERLLARDGRFVAQSPDSRFLIWKRDIPGGAEMLYLDLATGKGGPVFRDGHEGRRLFSHATAFSGQGNRLVTDLRDAQGAQSLLVVNLQDGRSRRIDLPAGQRFANWTTWAGERLVVPLQDAKGLSSRTYLVEVQ